VPRKGDGAIGDAVNGGVKGSLDGDKPAAWSGLEGESRRGERRAGNCAVRAPAAVAGRASVWGQQQQCSGLGLGWREGSAERQRARLPMVQRGNGWHTDDGINEKATWAGGRGNRRGLGSQTGEGESAVVSGIAEVVSVVEPFLLEHLQRRRANTAADSSLTCAGTLSCPYCMPLAPIH
jgi:hypothetical protein